MGEENITIQTDCIIILTISWESIKLMGVWRTQGRNINKPYALRSVTTQVSHWIVSYQGKRYVTERWRNTRECARLQAANKDEGTENTAGKQSHIIMLWMQSAVTLHLHIEKKKQSKYKKPWKFSSSLANPWIREGKFISVGLNGSLNVSS